MKKQLNTCLSLLLALALLLGMAPMTARAATITPKTPAGSGTAADPYLIGTAAELYGYAEIVNGGDDYDYLDGNKSAHAILTADITVNENVLDASGKPNGTDFIPWKPIERLSGVLDGRGHTVSGLYLYETEGMCCFIDEVWGTVRDLNIADSYFGSCYGSRPMRETGGICAVLDAAGTVWGCSFSGTVESDLGSGYPDYVGGIAGRCSGSIKECSVSGYISGKVKDCAYGIGGITGVCSGDIVNCHNSADIINRYTPAQDILDQQNWCGTGGIAGSVRFKSSVADCSNSGTVTAYGFVGGIAGYMEDSSVLRCFNTGTVQERYFVEGDSATKDTYFNLGGIVGFVNGSSGLSTIKNCYNTGSIRIRDRILLTSGSGSFFHGCGILGQLGYGNSESMDLSYCHNYNDIVKTAYFKLLPIGQPAGKLIQNCFYLADQAWDSVDGTTPYNSYKFRTGYVLNELNTTGNTGVWKQGEKYPELIAPAEIVLTGLEITTPPAKTAYTAGQSFDPTGMELTATYSDGSTLPVFGYTVVDGGTLLNNRTSVTVRYTDHGVTKSATQPITVTGQNPSFNVTVGTFGSGGGTYVAGSQVTLTAETPSGGEFLGWSGLADVWIVTGSVLTTTVTFIMPARNVTATPIFGAVTSISVTTPPDKTVYYAGEDFDRTGMVVTAYGLAFPDQFKFSMPIINYTVSGGSPLLEGQTKVTIRYGTRTGNTKSTTQAITVRTPPQVTVINGTGGGPFIPGTEVTVTAAVADNQIFWSWRGLPDDIEIIEGSAFTPSVTFVMPEENVTLEAILETFEIERPEGDGTEGNPFEISTVGELYWFAGFANGTITADDISMSVNEVHAKLMNDITVNPNLLADDYTLNVSEEDAALLAEWEPIDPANGYKGTFDGQGHTISGIYCAPQATENYRYGGFFRTLYGGGCIRDLTLADSYFRAPAKNSAYTGAFAGYIASYCTVENCHFDGTVTTAITADSSDADKANYPYVYIAGIAGDVVGEIRDCTARGLISGYGSAIGGIASYVSNGEVAGCVNEATVETPNNSGDIGGIVGRLYKGTVRDCRNKGNVIGRNSAGIVSNVEDKTSAVIRCWNEGDIEGSYGSGIVLSLSGTVQNCYNTGSVDEAGIAGTAYSGSSVAYCHNVGEITGYMGAPICSISSGSNITIENCYYLADSETDSVDGTTYKTAAQFADGTVLALLNGGDNTGNWRQDTKYPVLAMTYTVTVNGGTGSGEYGEGAAVTVTAEVPDGHVFAGWDGLDGLSGEDGQPARDTAATTFLMPARDVELTAQFVSTTPVRPANGDGTPENPFEISTLSELLWFRDFVNYDIAAPADCARPYEACAKLMNDITVNYALLGDKGGVRDDTKLEWTPIGKNDSYSYKGTFDGQGYAISGLYHGMGVNTSSVNSETYCLGLFGVLGSGGVIRDLTVKDSYLAVPYDQKYARVGGIVGSMGIGGALVENCHFDGLITTPNELSSTYKVGGIAGFCAATIRNCTAKGLITGYFTYGGGIAGQVARDTAGSGLIFGCRNETAVLGLHPYSDPVNDAAGGIAGEILNGTIRDCSNTGRIDAGNYQGGIAGYADGNAETPVTISRCWNEGEAVAGIVDTVYRNVHVKNCYNTGRVYAGIAHLKSGANNTITYCHNVGELYNDIGTSLYPIAATDGFTIENCYYLADEELDYYDGTTALSADRFSRQDLQMVTKLLNSKNAGNWKQGPDYPVLTDVGPTTIRGVCESYYVTRTSVPEIVVEDYYGPGATLVVAQYVDGCLRDLRLVAVTGDATFRFSEDVFDSVEGAEFIAYLYDESFSPICASAPLEVTLR